jgi:RHS repeat-associated protein
MSKGTSAMVAWTFDNRSTDLSGTAELDQTRSHNAANEITDLSGTANDPTHYAAGNMTADSSNTYIYDAWNRLVEAHDRGDDSLIATYEYDGQKRRVEKTVDSSTDDYFYNSDLGLRSLGGAGWQLLETRTDDDVDPSEQYVWDLRYVDAPVLRFQDTNTDGTVDNTLDYTNDANFNVTALVDESGTVVERYAYDPYGQVTVLDADWSTDADGVSDVDNTLGHQGLHLDTESALYYNRNRYYSPSLGRFTTRDPLGYVDGMNGYQYCHSASISGVDPSGLLKGMSEVWDEVYREERQRVARERRQNLAEQYQRSMELEWSYLRHAIHVVQNSMTKHCCESTVRHFAEQWAKYAEDFVNDFNSDVGIVNMARHSAGNQLGTMALKASLCSTVLGPGAMLLQSERASGAISTAITQLGPRAGTPWEAAMNIRKANMLSKQLTRTGRLVGKGLTAIGIGAEVILAGIDAANGDYWGTAKHGGYATLGALSFASGPAAMAIIGISVVDWQVEEFLSNMENVLREQYCMQDQGAFAMNLLQSLKHGQRKQEAFRKLDLR